jgi:hypothetical protein
VCVCRCECIGEHVEACRCVCVCVCVLHARVHAREFTFQWTCESARSLPHRTRYSALPSHHSLLLLGRCESHRRSAPSRRGCRLRDGRFGVLPTRGESPSVRSAGLFVLLLSTVSGFEVEFVKVLSVVMLLGGYALRCLLCVCRCPFLLVRH